MADVAALQAELALFQEAKRKLLLGQSVVEIRHGANELMKFSAANLDKISAHIADLAGQLTAAGVPTAGGRKRSTRVNFG